MVTKTGQKLVIKQVPITGVMDIWRNGRVHIEALLAPLPEPFKRPILVKLNEMEAALKELI